MSEPFSLNRRRIVGPLWHCRSSVTRSRIHLWENE